MLGGLVIVFREVLEAGLIVGIVLAATRGTAGRTGWIAGGIAGGVLGAGILAAFAGALADTFSGMGQEVFTAGILIVATIMLGWHTVWMARHGREMAARMREHASAVSAGTASLPALAVVVGVAVLREGAEVVLFLYGIFVAGQDGAGALVFGGLCGLALGGLVAWLLYRGLIQIPLRKLFAVTGMLVSLLAAGMAGSAAAVLAGAGLIPTLGDQVWDSSSILPERSLVGRALHALVGYADRPFGIQVLVYAATLVVLLAAGRLIGRAPSRRLGTARA